MTLNLEDIRATARHIAYSAGGILRAYFEGTITEDIKSSNIDIVTEADKDAEAYITRRLLDIYPDTHIVGEEGGGYGAPIEEATYRWYIDPVDGTTNFANKLPMFAISMALTDAHMTPLIGVVYAPIMNEMFTASTGNGATLNDVPIHVGRKSTLRESVLATGFPYHRATTKDSNLDRFGAFLVKCRGMRRYGSAAIDLAYVANGRFDGFWESYLNPWDLLAGALLVKEAGGIVSDYRGGTDPQATYQNGDIIAANASIHGEMCNVLAEVHERD